MKTLTKYISEKLSSTFEFTYGGKINTKDIPLTTLHFEYPEVATLYKISIADWIANGDVDNHEATDSELKTTWQLNVKLVIDGNSYYTGPEHETETFDIDSCGALNAMDHYGQCGRYYHCNPFDLFAICIGSILHKNEICNLHYQQLVEIAWGFGCGVYDNKSSNVKTNNFEDVKQKIKYSIQNNTQLIPNEIGKSVLNNKLFTSENYEKFKKAWVNLTKDDVKTYFDSLIKTVTIHK